jgi:hypothetical protein
MYILEQLSPNVSQWIVAGRWFSSDSPVSSTNETNWRDITEILLKVALNTITLTITYLFYMQVSWLNITDGQSVQQKQLVVNYPTY